MYNKIFSDIFFLGKKILYHPVFYADKVGANRIRRKKNSRYSDLSLHSEQ